MTKIKCVFKAVGIIMMSFVSLFIINQAAHADFCIPSQISINDLCAQVAEGDYSSCDARSLVALKHSENTLGCVMNVYKECVAGNYGNDRSREPWYAVCEQKNISQCVPEGKGVWCQIADKGLSEDEVERARK